MLSVGSGQGRQDAPRSWTSTGRQGDAGDLFGDGLDVEAAQEAVDQQLESRLVELEGAAEESANAMRALVRAPAMRSDLRPVFVLASSIRGRSMPERG